MAAAGGRPPQGGLYWLRENIKENENLHTHELKFGLCPVACSKSSSDNQNGRHGRAERATDHNGFKYLTNHA